MTRNYEEFWTYYLSQHQNPTCRWFHFVGTSLGFVLFVMSISQKSLGLAVGALVSGYLFSWLGHWLFEKNMPATFKFPIWSFRADIHVPLDVGGQGSKGGAVKWLDLCVGMDSFTSSTSAPSVCLLLGSATHRRRMLQ